MIPIAYIALGVEHAPIITSGGVVVAAVVAAFGSVQVAQIQHGHRTTKRAARAAALAAEYAKPTGNGYAASTRDALAELRDLVIEVRTEGRTNRRDLSARMDRIDQRLDQHLDKENNA